MAFRGYLHLHNLIDRDISRDIFLVVSHLVRRDELVATGQGDAIGSRSGILQCLDREVQDGTFRTFEDTTIR